MNLKSSELCIIIHYNIRLQVEYAKPSGRYDDRGGRSSSNGYRSRDSGGRRYVIFITILTNDMNNLYSVHTII